MMTCDDTKKRLARNIVTNDKETPLFPEEIKILAEAISGHNRTSNRIWIFAATVTLIVITAKVSNDGSVRFLSFNMDADALYPVSAFLLACLNFAYCSANLQAHRVTNIFHDRLEAINASGTTFTENFSLADAAHTIYLSNFARVFPLTHSLPKNWRKIVLFIKLFTDITFVMLPLYGCLFAFYQSQWSMIYQSQWSMIPQLFLWLVVLISFGATLVHFYVNFIWIYNRWFKSDQIAVSK